MGISGPPLYPRTLPSPEQYATPVSVTSPEVKTEPVPLQIIIKQHTLVYQSTIGNRTLAHGNLYFAINFCSVRLLSTSPLFTLLGISKTRHGCVLEFLATMGEDVLRKSCSLSITVLILIVMPLKVLGASIVSNPCIVGFPISQVSRRAYAS